MKRVSDGMKYVKIDAYDGMSFFGGLVFLLRLRF